MLMFTCCLVNLTGKVSRSEGNWIPLALTPTIPAAVEAAFEYCQQRNDDMDASSSAKWFAALSVKNKTLVLIRLMFEFSLVIRDITSSPLESGACRKLHGIGEMEHVITPYLLSLNCDDAERYADEDLIELLFAMPDDYGLEGAFQRAWHYASSEAHPPVH